MPGVLHEPETVTARLTPQTDPDHAVLFQPLRIGPVMAPNRFDQVPHCTGIADRAPDEVAAMREMKAMGGWGGHIINAATKPLHWRSRPALLGALMFNVDRKFKVNGAKKSDEHVCVEDTRE
jgi:hypothetical protein